MRASKAFRLGAAFLGILLLALAFLSMLLVGAHATHTCVDVHCAACACVFTVRTLFKQLLPLVFLAQLFLAALLCRREPWAFTAHRQRAATPIVLKTRLNP